MNKVKWAGRLSVLLIFILNLSCESENTHTKVQKEHDPLFTKLDYRSTGIDFANFIEDKPLMNIFMYQYYYNGAGVASGDLDNDGLPDLYFVGNFGKNHLYKNLGNFQFEDITDSSKASGSFGWSTGVCFVDINADGLLDIYLSKSGMFDVDQRRNQLLINKGGMKFVDEAKAYGLDDPGYSSQAAFLDFDLDGDLDAYIMNHPVKLDPDINETDLSKRKDDFASDHFYENRNGRFYNISDKVGLHNNSIGFGLGLAIADFNNDMYPDIYVGNDFTERDYLYINNGDKTFTDHLKISTRHTSNYSMGSDVADINNDGFLDFFEADMAAEDNYRSKTNMSGMNPEKFWSAVDRGLHYQYMINTLQLNNGSFTFEGAPAFSEISQMSGTDKTDWSWAPLFVDFDLDGYKDLLITNGLRKDVRNNDFVKIKKKEFDKIESKSQQEQLNTMKMLLDQMPSQKIPNYIYKNNGDLTFTNKIDEWGFNNPSFSNGATYSDLDNDGDLDIIINNIDDAAFVYRNNTREQNYLQLKLQGPAGNTSGLGTKVILSGKDGIQYAEHYMSRGYLSSVEDKIHFGLGTKGKIELLTVIWPDGKIQEMENVKANQLLTLNYVNADKEGMPSEYVRSSYKFKEMNKALAYHVESEYDDYEKQVLLPHEMSHLGPCLCVGDVNSDGKEDIILGGAKGYSTQLLIQNESRSFVKKNIPHFDKDKIYEDVGCTLFDADMDGDLDLYIVSGSSEGGIQSSLYQDRLYSNNGNGLFEVAKDMVPHIQISGSCVVPHDFDSDGDLDLFVGGRQIPERYPEPVNSFILINDKGKFDYMNDKFSGVLKDLGMVTDAYWFDYDSDGKSDLLLVGEWMPITVILQEEVGDNKKIEIENSLGWWNSISVEDLNNDGKPDFVLTNLGLNVKYKANPGSPFIVYSKDFDENGSYDIVLSTTKGKNKFPVRGRQCSSEQLPEITEKFPTYDLFAKATVEDIYSKEDLETALKYEAVDFKSSILMSGSDGYQLRALPNYAQISASQDAIIRDFNNDGIRDILLAGNMEEMEVETPRCDASYGVLLIGDGDGSYNVSPAEYSLNMSGNVRQIEMITIDGREYILVARNNGPLSLIKP